MAFITYETVNGARLVKGVFRTQAEANTAASGDASLTAYTGSVNDSVEPGRFVNSAGSLLSSVPAAVRDARTAIEDDDRLHLAFLAFIDDFPFWRESVASDFTAVRTASIRWAWHQVALGDAIADKSYLGSLSTDDRASAVEHIAKALEDNDGLAFRIFAGSSTPRRNWSTVGVESRSGSLVNIHTDLFAGSTAQNQTGAFTRTTATIPLKFDPSYPTLREP